METDKDIIISALEIYKSYLVDLRRYGSEVYEYSEIVSLISKTEDLLNKYKEG